jgi:hypothetical protein
MGTHDDPLDILKVIDRLEVGSAKLERKRLAAPYKVTQNNQEYTKVLVYSYEEDVFDPAEMESQNLADMIAAQVALNYGLFCRTIVFRGMYDESDQRFIREMAENTAREIYVKKFLEPNPFLIGEVKNLPVLKKERYSNAELVFLNKSTEISKRDRKPWQTNPNRHAILSSGGKDSLLTFGLINELGHDVHPLFGNESGRHWFTALNAYRYFKKNIPKIARVWMNSDRLFAWMLRRLPFVRKDFANIRSDEYPIRLWTIAVFLFGMLPLLRKRGIGRILIGDEYDSTWKTSYHGITHYDGLYDQSRFFDNRLTKYYTQKGRDISQFSILRQLSEILILKILINRYPDLHAQQVSCHAAHMGGGRVYPCGKCEKCRRIIGMLMALGEDPGRCGYSQKQIDRSLKDLIKQGIHQELAGTRHLMWMLAKKGLIEFSDQQIHISGPHLEIMQLRFHPERSPIDGIPHNLRKPLYAIFQEYADGMVQHNGQGWKKFDPFKELTVIPENNV